MSYYRIFAIVLKSFYVTKRSWDRIADVFYWSAIDLIVWGITSRYFTQLSNGKGHILDIIISGIIFWIIVWRGQQEISVNLLEDLWNKNLINMFVSPLTFAEWVSGFIIVSIIKVTISFLFAGVLAFLLYRINVLSYGVILFPVSLILLMNAWWIGFVIAGVIIRYGTKIQALAWSLVSILAPFSAIYYPLQVLPLWAQYIAHILPTSYLFTIIHAAIQQQPINMTSLGISFGLSTLYLMLAIWFLKRSFTKVLQKGLVKLY